jgi:hypothetical protein
MEIRSKLTEKDYINVTFVILFSKMSVRVFAVIFGIILLTNSIGSVTTGRNNYGELVMPLIICLVICGFLYFAAKNNFAKNARVKEAICYKFTQDYLEISGKSFNSQFTWDKVPKVTLTKNWLLIWQNNQMANAIPRDNIRGEEIEKLKEILSRHSVKNNLR